MSVVQKIRVQNPVPDQSSIIKGSPISDECVAGCMSSLELMLASRGSHIVRGEGPVEAIHVLQPVCRHNSLAL